MERSKEQKRRWYQGLLRWKRQKHITAVEEVLGRVASLEFRLCPELVAILHKIQVRQTDVFAKRKEFVETVFSREVDNWNSANLRTTEEQINQLSERNAEDAD